MLCFCKPDCLIEFLAIFHRINACLSVFQVTFVLEFNQELWITLQIMHIINHATNNPMCFLLSFPVHFVTVQSFKHICHMCVCVCLGVHFNWLSTLVIIVIFNPGLSCSMFHTVSLSWVNCLCIWYCSFKITSAIKKLFSGLINLFPCFS